jgi:hypothetical protein
MSVIKIQQRKEKKKMVDMKALTDKINDSGMSFKAVAEKSGNAQRDIV